MAAERPGLAIEIDLSTVRRGAEGVADTLRAARQKRDLERFEYCKAVRIAPTETPHSHPMITLNTWMRDEMPLVCVYLHEQMHWYVTWFSHARPEAWLQILDQLKRRYPRVPAASAGGALDDYSTYLHLVVNLLEIDAASQVFERADVVDQAQQWPYYKWIYQTVVSDCDPLRALYREAGLLPIRSATDMSAEDLALAARAEEYDAGQWGR